MLSSRALHLEKRKLKKTDEREKARKTGSRKDTNMKVKRYNTQSSFAQTNKRLNVGHLF